MPLGASATTVVAMVLKQSLRLAAFGIGAGVVLALAASSFFASRVQMMDAFDVLGYAGGVALVIVASVAAAYVPSRRAATIDPLQALRHD